MFTSLELRHFRIGAHNWSTISSAWLCACGLPAGLHSCRVRSNWPGFSLINLIGLASQMLPSTSRGQAHEDASANQPHRASIEREAALHAPAGIMTPRLSDLTNNKSRTILRFARSNLWMERRKPLAIPPSIRPEAAR